MEKKINFKQPKYILPLIALPFILFVGYQSISIFGGEEKQEVVQKEMNTDLGKVDASILNKNEAYDKLFQNDKNNRTMLQEIDQESDSLFTYSDNLDDAQKRYLDSLAYERDRARNNQVANNERDNYYTPQNNKEDKDYERSKEIIKMLNDSQQQEPETEPKSEFDPVKSLREQMLFMDSLEKTKDPQYQREMMAQKRLRENKEKMEEFLNTTMDVHKSNTIGQFNHISKEKPNNTIKAVIDENIKGYLGSRIRIRLLEDIFIGKKKMAVKKGSFLYAEISGFSMQRVELNIISVMVDNQIYPINLSVFDMDGMRGLYVPASAFREMTRELGANSVQGMNVESGQGFFTSLASSLFRSASDAVIAIIRKNKVTLKYSTYIYLINEKELNKNKSENE
ncbi:MAG: conjugative transposon protein TraM [Capnocytophaga sp.]|nr:conjugative transposon protein TraM [Capnocytophaga sp.]